jgi:hypothetical protein
MKGLALVLMLLTLLAIVGFGLFYLLGFAMSFDAPGSDKDPAAWGMRLLMFAPVIIFLILLVFSWKSYSAGHFNQSVVLGAVAPVLCLGAFLLMYISSMSSLKDYQQQVALEKEEAARYPIEKYMRHGPEGTDTIIVFPSRIVSYRLYQGPNMPFYGGPLGDLNETRDILTYHRGSDTKLQMEELYHFMDEEGNIFTNRYQIR